MIKLISESNMLCIIILFQVTLEQGLFYSAYDESTLDIQDFWQFFGNTSSNIISTCGSDQIIGGYDIFSRGIAATLFIELPPHYKMEITFTLFIIDTWDNENFYVYTDQDLIYQQQFSNKNSNLTLCGQTGDNRKDQIYQIQVEFDHTGQTSFIQLTSNLNDSAIDESWGFRNFRIYLYECPPGCYVCSKDDSQLSCEKWVRVYIIFTQMLYNQFQENAMIQIIDGETTKQQCSNLPIMCGYGACGRSTKIIMNNLQLPFHTRIKIKLKYLKIDSWESTEKALILVDGVIRWSSALNRVHQYIYGVCGGNSNDILINLELTFSHIYTSTTISIINTLDEEFTNESFGIRDITIFTEQSICGDQVVQENEDCDDGNLIPFDGCFSCQFSCIEGCEICEKGQCLLCRQGWIFQREISYCQRVDTTVPSIQSKFKENLFEGEILNGCQHECKICIQSVCYQCQLEHTLIFGQCYILAEITWEECNSNCLVCRNGLCFKCQQNYQIFDNKCVGICGDQIVQDNEDCDDGNNIELDGCFNCLYSCPRDCNYCEKGICQDLCQKGYYFNNNSCATICGDSIIAGTEQCEDENTIEYDGCYQCQYSCPLYCNDCLNGQCYDCDSGFILSQNICINICGDGLLSILEQCDDGNQINGDGCSKTCELESNYICNLDGQCAYVEYPIPIIEYYQQINQFQYVKMTFSQKVQQKQNLDYKDTIKLRIIDLDQDLFQIIILENQPVQCQIQNVEYIFQIEILTNRLNHPILEVILTEQLYNENQAPLLDLVNYIQLNQPNYISEGEKMISKSIQKVNEYSINALFTVQAVLFLVGNFDSFQIILDALQNQVYLKYINVLFPQTLIIYFESSDAVSMQSKFNLLPIQKYNATLPQFPYQKSYEKFEYYNINSNILEGLIIEVVIFLSVFLGYLSTLFSIYMLKQFEINKYLQQWPKFIIFLQKLKKKMHSKLKLFSVNLIKMTLFACSWDLIFMAFLELQVKHNFEQPTVYIRLLIALIILIILVIIMLQQLNGLKSWQKQNFIQYWEQKHELIILIKKLLSLYILIYHQKNQILQTLVLTLINVFYLLFLIKCKSQDRHQEYIKNIIMEISITIFTASTFTNWNIFSSYFSYQQRIIISWIQMFVLVSVLILFLLIEIYNIFQIILEKVKKILYFNRNQSHKCKKNEFQNINALKVNPNNIQQNQNKQQIQQKPIHQRIFYVGQ